MYSSCLSNTSLSHVKVKNIGIFCGVSRVAYVRQEDIFFSQLTVRETLSLAAELQLPSSLTSEERTKYVDNILQRLGLVM